MIFMYSRNQGGETTNSIGDEILVDAYEVRTNERLHFGQI